MMRSILKGHVEFLMHALHRVIMRKEHLFEVTCDTETKSLCRYTGVGTESELTVLCEEKEADLFRFGEITDDSLKLFTTHWHRKPFTQKYTSLL